MDLFDQSERVFFALSNNLCEESAERNLDKLFARLTARQQLLLEFFYYQKLSLQDIAGTLHCSPYKVKREITRAINIFRKDLHPEKYTTANAVLYSNLPNRISY